MPEEKHCKENECIPYFECKCDIETLIEKGTEIENSDVYCNNCEKIRIENICDYHRFLYDH